MSLHNNNVLSLAPIQVGNVTPCMHRADNMICFSRPACAVLCTCAHPQFGIYNTILVHLNLMLSLQYITTLYNTYATGTAKLISHYTIPHSSHYNYSTERCDVVCLKTAKIFLRDKGVHGNTSLAVFLINVTITVPQLLDPQSTLWVGTAGGSLGVFTITRKDEQGLRLERTGEYPCMKWNHGIVTLLCR